jgi:NADH-quinone oxidoreductase subunit A
VEIAMTPTHFDGLMPIVILMGLAVLLFVGGHFASVLLAPKKPSHLKSTPYECGELPVGSAWSMFNVRFYVVGLIFIIFDVESVLMFPVVSIFRELNDMGQGGYALIILVSFISVLIEGIAYCWRKGDLDWVKSYQVSQRTHK